MKITAVDYRRILDLAAAAYPAECCGLLVGVESEAGDWTVTRLVPAANVAPEEPSHSARDRFEVDPQIRIDLERELRDQEENVIGHYHSHPDYPAVPSATDLAKAYEPSLCWVIASVMTGKASELAAFRLFEDRFVSVALEVLDEC
ncbi:MAG: M67 family metallopeptidase [Pseudomonadota bacterium]|nr:M67 family metallopeptidase [Pseudomonadota bacterium]